VDAVSSPQQPQTPGDSMETVQRALQSLQIDPWDLELDIGTFGSSTNIKTIQAFF